jgi:hypothetical protein
MLIASVAMSDSFRESIAARLISGESLPRITLARAAAAGFKAYVPIEDFLNNMPGDTPPPRSMVREEEALESLGSISDWPFSPSSGKGVTLYRSALLEELRRKQRESGSAFRKKSREEEVAILIRSLEFPKAYESARRQLAIESAGIVSKNDYFYSVELERKFLRETLTQSLTRVNFKRASRLDRYSHISYRRDLGTSTLLFAVDATRPMQDRCVIVPSNSNTFDIFQPLIAKTINLNSTSFALMAGGRPYVTPDTRPTLEIACEFYAIALQALSEKLLD